MPDPMTPRSAQRPTRIEPSARQDSQDSILEARPKPETPNAEEMFLSPRVLDGGAFARYAEMLKSLISEARTGARKLEDFSADADQMHAQCQHTGNEIRVRLEAGARLVKLIDERADRAERLLEETQSELPNPEQLRARFEPIASQILDDAASKADNLAALAEQRVLAKTEEIEQRLNAAAAHASEQADRLQRAEATIDQKLAALDERLAALESAGSQAATLIDPQIARAEQAAAELTLQTESAVAKAEKSANAIEQRVQPLQSACDAIASRMGVDPNNPNETPSVVNQLETLLAQGQTLLGASDQLFAQLESLKEQASGARNSFGDWLLSAAEDLDALEARKDKLQGPLAEAAQHVAQVSPQLAEQIEMASTELEHLQTEQRILRETVQASSELAKQSGEELNTRAAHMKALVDGSLKTLTERVEQAGVWLGDLIARAEQTGQAMATPTTISAPVSSSSPIEAPVDAAPPAAEPQVWMPTPVEPSPETQTYEQALPPALPIDAMSFDGSETVIRRDDDTPRERTA